MLIREAYKLVTQLLSIPIVVSIVVAISVFSVLVALVFPMLSTAAASIVSMRSSPVLVAVVISAAPIVSIPIVPIVSIRPVLISIISTAGQLVLSDRHLFHLPKTFVVFDQ